MSRALSPSGDLDRFPPLPGIDEDAQPGLAAYLPQRLIYTVCNIVCAWLAEQLSQFAYGSLVLGERYAPAHSVVEARVAEQGQQGRGHRAFAQRAQGGGNALAHSGVEARVAEQGQQGRGY